MIRWFVKILHRALQSTWLVQCVDALNSLLTICKTSHYGDLDNNVHVQGMTFWMVIQFLTIHIRGITMNGEYTMSTLQGMHYVCVSSHLPVATELYKVSSRNSKQIVLNNPFGTVSGNYSVICYIYHNMKFHLVIECYNSIRILQFFYPSKNRTNPTFSTSAQGSVLHKQTPDWRPQKF